MREIRDLLKSINEKTGAQYSERILKIFMNISDFDVEIIKAWLKAIDEKL
jgi:hypothetical protein